MRIVIRGFPADSMDFNVVLVVEEGIGVKIIGDNASLRTVFLEILCYFERHSLRPAGASEIIVEEEYFLALKTIRHFCSL